MVHMKIHLIRPGCPNPSVALQSRPKTAFILLHSLVVEFLEVSPSSSAAVAVAVVVAVVVVVVIVVQASAGPRTV